MDARGSSFVKLDVCQVPFQIYGNLKNFLVPAPTSLWQELLPEKVAMHKQFTHVSVHKIDVNYLPYEGIRYLVAAAAANG